MIYINKLPHFEINVDNIDSPMYAVSLVAKPAIEVLGFAFADLNQKEFKFTEVEGVLIAPILIPNKKIIRQHPITKEYFTVSFSGSTIKKIRDKFNKNYTGNVINLEHSEIKLNATIVENWIKEFDIDKSNNYGFDLPIDTYFAYLKFDDLEWFKDNVVNGDFRGLSIEIDVDLISAKFSKEAFLYSLHSAELLALQNLLFDRISYDWDGTLEHKMFQETAMNEIQDGDNVYIISARDEVSNEMLNTAKEIGIKPSNIFAVGSNENKIKKIKELNIDTHYDNNKDVINNLGEAGQLVEPSKLNFEVVRGDANSSNIKNWIYNSKKKILFITFNDNSKYKYYSVSGSEFKNVINGNAACLTNGSSKYGSWWIGKYPSQGAALYRYVINNDKRFEKV